MTLAGGHKRRTDNSISTPLNTITKRISRLSITLSLQASGQDVIASPSTGSG
jgi:hypothetical protein